jgi:hypothetical protein
MSYSKFARDFQVAGLAREFYPPSLVGAIEEANGYRFNEFFTKTNPHSVEELIWAISCAYQSPHFYGIRDKAPLRRVLENLPDWLRNELAIATK